MEPIDSRKRYREIGAVLAQNGFSWLWSEWGIGKILGKFEHDNSSRGGSTHTQPERLRRTFEQLGTTFIKIGQMLSTRPDLIPPDYVAELSKLQDHVPEVSYAEIEEAILREFGRRPEEVFLSFNPKPRAAASISQVHDAVLPDGTPVVVKVQRPNIVQQVNQDLAILSQIVRFSHKHTEIAKQLDLEGLVEEFAFTLRNELNFVREGQNAERIAEEFTKDRSLNVPKIYWDFSTPSVLTMEAIEGIKINDLAALDAAGIDRHVLAERCAHIALVQILDNGFFHADPHPGNFFVMPDGVISLIDYGMVGQLKDRTREALVRLALAVSRHDAERLVEELLALGAVQGHVGRRGLEQDLNHLMLSFEGLPLGGLKADQIFKDVMVIAQRHGLRLPGELIVLARVIVMDEGLGATLDPTFNLIDFAKPYYKRFWKKSHSLGALTDRVKDSAIDFADLSSEFPRRVMRLIGSVERGEVTVTTRLESQDQLIHGLQKAANRIAISILTSGLVIGLSVLALVYRPAGSEGFGYFLLKALLGAGVVSGVWLLFAFWRSSK